jgi:hypothetical protein
MALKATFSAGETTKRISALYQWDYGQQLEIESADLPTLVEVHFACPDMSEAIVRVCSVSNGIATVTIPDRCLEQSNTITAWVYEIHGTTGSTTKAVVIPVTARTRPCRSAEIPQDVSDRYTELIAEVNEAVGKLTSGEIMVASAAKATSADRAISAENASTAAYATAAYRAEQANKADEATIAMAARGAMKADTATEAERATADKTGADIAAKYTYCDGGFAELASSTLLGNGIWQFQVYIFGVWCCAILDTSAGATTQASLGDVDGIHYVLRYTNGSIRVMYSGTESDMVESGVVIKYRQINNW